jgi:micrococcal nuclease
MSGGWRGALQELGRFGIVDTRRSKQLLCKESPGPSRNHQGGMGRNDGGSQVIYIYKAEIVWVIDGDTFDLFIDLGFDNFRRCRMRLYGIDAPELRTKAGKAVQNEVEQITYRMGSECYVQSIANSKKRAIQDKYGRYLAIIYDQLPAEPKVITNGQKLMDVAPDSLNARLVNAGLVKERYWR